MLLSKGIIHAKKFGVSFVKEEAVNATVTESAGKKAFTIKTSGGLDLHAHSMIIATGTPIKFSGIKNEEKFIGRGVHYCISCDGAMYKNKRLVVIGNSDHAAEDAIEALSYTKDITIIANDSTFKFSDAFDKEITKYRIKTMIGKVSEIHGEKFIDKVIMEDGTSHEFDGIFMACGSAGALDFAANLGLEIKDNTLVIDDNNMTSMEGVFAAGNCAGRCRQIAKNIGDGCNAGVNAIKYLRSRELYMDYGHHDVDVDNLEPTPYGTKVKKLVIETQKVTVAKKLRIGWFSFSCCEDSTIVFTEILNDNYDKLKEIFEFAHVRVLKKNNDMNNLDISFIEGAISNDRQVEEVKKIRANSKKVIAIGACACTGMPSGQRNTFDEERKCEIEPIIRTFDYNKKVMALHEVIQVDDNVPGCPMLESNFIAVVNKQLKEFGVNAQL